MIERIFRKLYNDACLKTALKSGMVIGKNCRFTGDHNFGSEPYLISMGNNVTISSGVTFVNHDGSIAVLKNIHPEIYSDVIKFAKIEIGNNVFVGTGSVIMPGVKIGDNTIIGAGSLVTGEIEANSVYAGRPAKKIMSIDAYGKKCLSNTPLYDKDRYKSDKKNYLIELLGK